MLLVKVLAISYIMHIMNEKMIGKAAVRHEHQFVRAMLCPRSEITPDSMEISGKGHMQCALSNAVCLDQCKGIDQVVSYCQCSRALVSLPGLPMMFYPFRVSSRHCPGHDL